MAVSRDAPELCAFRGEVAQSLHLRQVPAPSLVTTWSPWENELSGLGSVIKTLLPACLGQHRLSWAVRDIPAPGQDLGLSRRQLQGLTPRDARWQGEQPLSYYEGVLRQTEGRWGQESTVRGEV